MKTKRTAETDGNLNAAEANKQALADYFGVGVRTIENWLAWGIIVGRKDGRQLLMDVVDCDERLMRHRDSDRQNNH